MEAEKPLGPRPPKPTERRDRPRSPSRRRRHRSEYATRKPRRGDKKRFRQPLLSSRGAATATPVCAVRMQNEIRGRPTPTVPTVVDAAAHVRAGLKLHRIDHIHAPKTAPNTTTAHPTMKIKQPCERAAISTKRRPGNLDSLDLTRIRPEIPLLFPFDLESKHLTSLWKQGPIGARISYPMRRNPMGPNPRRCFAGFPPPPRRSKKEDISIPLNSTSFARRADWGLPCGFPRRRWSIVTGARDGQYHLRRNHSRRSHPPTAPPVHSTQLPRTPVAPRKHRPCNRI